MADSYYGVYLIPPPDLVYAISVAHGVLAREFNARTAGAFMVHCTLKGFTRLADEASLEAIVPALDKVFAKTPRFTTRIQPPWISSRGTGKSVLLWLTKGEEFQRLHNSVWEVIEPYVSPQCLFTLHEKHGDDFPPHITLAQHDLSSEPGLLAQGKALCDFMYESLPSKEFEGRYYQLIEFESEDWAGAWGETLRFKQIKGWNI